MRQLDLFGGVISDEPAVQPGKKPKVIKNANGVPATIEVPEVLLQEEPKHEAIANENYHFNELSEADQLIIDSFSVHSIHSHEQPTIAAEQVVEQPQEAKPSDELIQITREN